MIQSRIPKWFDGFEKEVKRFWSNKHSTLELTCSSAYNIAMDEWVIMLAPSKQEYYGGEFCGSKTWSPFTFDVLRFVQKSKIRPFNYFISSASNDPDAIPYPNLCFQSLYRKNRVNLHIILEPLKTAKVTEIIDMISCQVRKKVTP